MEKILFDTNIILDWLLERQPFFENSTLCIKQCRNGQIEGYLTPHSISDIFYILRKEKGLNHAKFHIKVILNIFSGLTENDETLQSIVTSNEWEKDIWNDVEDALQMSAAYLNQMDYILTRNSKDFEFSKIKNITPEEYLEKIS